MFGRKKTEKEKLELIAKAREMGRDVLKRHIYEIESFRQTSVKAGVFTNEEIAEMTDEYLKEAYEHSSSMGLEEIFEEEDKRFIDKAKTIVIEVGK